ncbi:MAG: hypothetical protein ACREQQ_15120 [Candidatus Binatia bacterium]
MSREAAAIAPAARVFARARARLLPHALIAAVFLHAVGRFYAPGDGFTPLIHFGAEFEGRSAPALRTTAHFVETGRGYDAQFYAQLALDPFLRERATITALDNPPYRARRILLPAIAHLLGLGEPWLVLQAYGLLNVVSWIILGLVLLRWLPPGGTKRTLAWIGCVLSQGLLASVSQSLLEGPSLVLLALSVRAVERNRRRLAAVVLGLAGLARETNVLGIAVLAGDDRSPKAMISLLVQGLLVAMPLLMWTGYLWHLGLPAADIGSRNFALPFQSYVEKWHLVLRAPIAANKQMFLESGLLPLVALTTQATALAWWRDYGNPWWRVGMANAALMIVLGPAVWEGYPGAITRAVLPMTVAFNILLPRARWFWPIWFLGNLNVVIGLDLMRILAFW